MRTVKASLLTILICVNLFGFYAMFIFRQTEIKNEMTELIKKASSSGYETLTFSNKAFAQLSFNEEGRELRLNGRLYDVVRIEYAGSQTRVIVEYDAKETDLIASFTELLNQQQDKAQNSSPLKTIISHFQQDYVSVHAYKFLAQPALIMAGIITNYSYHTSSFVSDNLTPPPQFFLS